MTQYTVPDDLPIPEGEDVVRALEEKFEDLANAVQLALSRPGAVASATERDAAYPTPVQGQRVYRTDMGWDEEYFTAPAVRVPDWYPVTGATPAYSATPLSGDWKLEPLTTANKTLQLPTTPTVNRGFTVDATAGTITILHSGLYAISISRRANAPMLMQWNLNGTTVQASKNTDIFNTLAHEGVALTAGDVIVHQVATVSGSSTTAGQQNNVAVTYLGPA